MNAAILHFVSDPNYAVLLLVSGIFLIYAEFNRPGTVLLGCAGALSILFAVDGFLHTELRQSALCEIALGTALLAFGFWFPLRGVTASTSAASLAYGFAHLVVAPPISPVLALASSIVFCVVTSWLVRTALRARRNKSIYSRFEAYPRVPTVQPFSPARRVD